MMMVMSSVWSALILLLVVGNGESLITVQPAGCKTSCGGVDVPYPFGVGENCSRPGFEIDCVNNTMPILKGPSQKIQVLELSVMPLPQARVRLPVAYQCYNASGDGTEISHFGGSVNFNKGGVYRISNNRNKLVVLGCNTFVYTNSGPWNRSWSSFYSGCVAYCDNSGSAQDGACAGIGCCQTDIPPGLTDNSMTFKNDGSWKHTDQGFSPCDYAFIVDKDNYTFRASDLLMDTATTMPLVLDWAIRDSNINRTGSLYSCAQAQASETCVSVQSECINSTNGPGYYCSCAKGYEGNPYVQNGCTNINECARPEVFSCYGECHDTEGSYNCKCPRGYQSNGDPKTNQCNPKFPLAARLALGIGLGVSFVVVALMAVFIVVQKRQLDKLFEKNGGKVLQNVKGLTIFSKEGLKKITKNNSEFLGNGSFGKVYKGTLPDNTIVAVKASIIVNEATKKEFTEEVEIQTHMIHKNILKLVGCCLEVDIPMLVYEYAAKGSLQETLHGNKNEKLSLDMRIDIAIGSAEGLRYMHSFTTQGAIRHGDVKPDNILLDDMLTPKISDFGLSKLLKEESIANRVVGCMGYIDPVFMKTGLLTQKSDVYSFGAVLLELITGKKNVYDENHSLIIEYCKVYEKEKSGRSMFDKEIVTQDDIFILEEIGNLAIECLEEDLEDRPDMTEVAERLVMLRRDRKLGNTQNRTPQRLFEDFTIDVSPDNTDVSRTSNATMSVPSTPANNDSYDNP